ncbi:DUF396 doamin protein, partial [Pseudovirgaria hyperparasitica]
HIASGLYYLSELVEEHTVLAKKLLNKMIYVVIAIQTILLLVDRFPFLLSIFSIASHVVYAQNLRRFPVVKLTDPIFLVSCALVLTNHYLWFRHFSAPPSRPPPAYPGYYTGGRDYTIPTFTEIASYFGLCVWLVPFALFVSLSAGENVLPSMGSEYATGVGSSFASAGQEPVGLDAAERKKRVGLKGNGSGNAGMAKAVVNGVREWVGETGEAFGLWKGERTRPF